MIFVISSPDPFIGEKLIMIHAVAREILLSFWKVHILHHAAEGRVYGQWMTQELRRHGYAISPGTLYPLLNRLERHGWLECVGDPNRRIHARKEYRITAEGRKVLALVRSQVGELYREVVVDAHKAITAKRSSRRKEASWI